MSDTATTEKPPEAATDQAAEAKKPWEAPLAAKKQAQAEKKAAAQPASPAAAICDTPAVQVEEVVEAPFDPSPFKEVTDAHKSRLSQYLGFGEGAVINMVFKMVDEYTVALGAAVARTKKC